MIRKIFLILTLAVLPIVVFAQSTVQQANTAFASGNYADAKDLYEMAAGFAEDSAERDKLYAKAKTAGDLKSLREKAEKAYKEDNYELATDYYNKILKLNPKDTLASRRIGGMKEATEWNEVKNISDVIEKGLAAKDFLIDYPNSDKKQEAQKFIKEGVAAKESADLENEINGIVAKAESAYKDADYSKAEELYNSAVQKKYNSEYEKKAGLCKTLSLHKVIADSAYSAEKYEDALDKYSFIYRNNTYDVKAKEGMSNCNDNIEWNKVKEYNSKGRKAKASEEYLSKYPNGLHKKEAEEFIAAANKNKKKPSAQPTSTQTRAATSQTASTTSNLSVSQDVVYAPADGAELLIVVTSAGDWSYVAPNSNMFIIDRHEEYLTIKVNKNNSTESRTDYFYVKTSDGASRVKITVNQSGNKQTRSALTTTSSYSSTSRSSSYYDDYSYQTTPTRSASTSSVSTKSTQKSSNDVEMSTYQQYCANYGKFDMDWIGIGASLGTNIGMTNFNLSLNAYVLRMRLGWFQLCPADFTYGMDFVYGGTEKEYIFMYTPSANIVIPVMDTAALYFGAGPTIDIFGERDIWFKAEAGIRAHWNKYWVSDFYLRYDGMVSVGLTIGL